MGSGDGRSVSRVARAGIATTVLVTGYWVVLVSWASGSRCASSSTNPFPCVTGAVAGVLLGLPLVIGLVAWSLAGRGLAHALVGAVVSVLGATAVIYAVLAFVDYSGPDLAGWALCGPAAGVVAAVWADRAPGRPRRDRAASAG